MNCVILKDLFSFVFLRNCDAKVRDFFKGESAGEICGIVWRRVTWNGVDWPKIAVHNQPPMKEMKRKRKAYWMCWIILFCSQPRDWMGCVIGLSGWLKCVIRNTLDCRQCETCTHGSTNIVFKNNLLQDTELNKDVSCSSKHKHQSLVCCDDTHFN